MLKCCGSDFVLTDPTLKDRKFVISFPSPIFFFKAKLLFTNNHLKARLFPDWLDPYQDSDQGRFENSDPVKKLQIRSSYTRTKKVLVFIKLLRRSV